MEGTFSEPALVFNWTFKPSLKGTSFLPQRQYTKSDRYSILVKIRRSLRLEKDSDFNLFFKNSPGSITFTVFIIFVVKILSITLSFDFLQQDIFDFVTVVSYRFSIRTNLGSTIQGTNV